MFSIEQYMEMARECLAAAEQTKDPARRQALIDAAKLYTQGAAESHGLTVQPPDKPKAA
jgi:hypothetical protein